MKPTAQSTRAVTDAAEITALIARWSKAVRDQDMAGIRADHDADILMFDVPPPFASRGLDAASGVLPTSTIRYQPHRESTMSASSARPRVLFDPHCETWQINFPRSSH